jgi:hypothetical protein
MPHAPSPRVLLMPNSNHLTYSISNLVSLITKTKLGLSPPPLQKSRAGFASPLPTFLATRRRVTPSLHCLRSRASAHRSSLSRHRHFTRSRLRFHQGTTESAGSSSSARHGRACQSLAPREPRPLRLYCFISLRHWLRFGTAKRKPHSLGSLRPLSAVEPPCSRHCAPLSPASTIRPEHAGAHCATGGLAAGEIAPPQLLFPSLRMTSETMGPTGRDSKRAGVHRSRDT